MPNMAGSETLVNEQPGHGLTNAGEDLVESGLDGSGKVLCLQEIG